jgi:hypothetical protein
MIRHRDLNDILYAEAGRRNEFSPIARRNERMINDDDACAVSDDLAIERRMTIDPFHAHAPSAYIVSLDPRRSVRQGMQHAVFVNRKAYVRRRPAK